MQRTAEQVKQIANVVVPIGTGHTRYPCDPEQIGHMLVELPLARAVVKAYPEIMAMLRASEATALALLAEKKVSPEERDRALSKLGSDARRVAELLDHPEDTSAPAELRGLADRLRSLATRSTFVR